MCYPDITDLVTTIDRFRGFRIVIYLNDHRPPHVHVMGRGLEAVFELNCPAGPIQLRENYGFSRVEIATIRKRLEARLELFCRRWRDLHG